MTAQDLAWLTWDNPVLLKHVRSRMRPARAVPWLVVVAVACVSICWAGYELNWLISGQALAFITAIQVFALLFVGAIQVGSSATKARTSGILDFHRVAPLPAPHLTLGFFFGGPVFEYATFGVTLPFALYCADKAPIGLGGYLVFLIPLLLACWIAHGLALLNALMGKAVGGAARGVLGAILMFYLIGGGVGGMLGFAGNVFARQAGSVGFFGWDVPWLPLVVGYQVPVVLFLLVGSIRRMRSDRAHAYSKPVALAATAGLAAMLLGVFWQYGDQAPVVLIILHALMLASIILLSAVTPDAPEYARGVRRARRRGLQRPRPWEDLALNRPLILALGLVVLAAPTIAWSRIEGPSTPFFPEAGRMSYSLPIAIGVLVVAYFGLALQWFLLRFRRGATLMGLFLFLAWGLPIVAGSVVAATTPTNLDGTPRETVALSLLSLSPLAGITLSSGVGPPAVVTDAVRASALIPPLVLALLFNNLVTTARRRADRALDEAPDPGKAPSLTPRSAGLNGRPHAPEAGDGPGSRGPGIEDPDVIDILGRTPDGKPLLVITDAGLSTSDDERFEKLVAKLSTYTGFILGDAFREQFPGCRPSDATIRVVCAGPPTEAMARIHQVTPRGDREHAIAVEFEVLGDEEGTMLHAPAVESASRVGDLPVGTSHTAVLYDTIESAGPVQYAFLLEVVEDASQKPVFFVASEVNGLATLIGGGSHFLGVFDGRGHANLGSSDDWGDRDKFFPEALRIARERFGASTTGDTA